MNTILIYQVSMFGNYDSIKPTPENIKKVLSSFEGFIPALVGVSSVDVITNTIKTDNRLQLVSLDGSKTIVFLQERIDINYNWNPDLPSFTDIDSLSEEILSILNSLSSLYSELKGNRLTTSTMITYKDFQESKLASSIYGHSYAKLLFSNVNGISEWSNRMNNQENVKIGENQEMSNHIITLTFLNKSDEKKFTSLIDINTVPQNTLERFDFSDLISYSKEAVKIIKNDIERIKNVQ